MTRRKTAFAILNVQLLRPAVNELEGGHDFRHSNDKISCIPSVIKPSAFSFWPDLLYYYEFLTRTGPFSMVNFIFPHFLHLPVGTKRKQNAIPGINTSAAVCSVRD